MIPRETIFLFTGPMDATLTILLVHSAGAPMDSASMTAISSAVAAGGILVARSNLVHIEAAELRCEQASASSGNATIKIFGGSRWRYEGNLCNKTSAFRLGESYE